MKKIKALLNINEITFSVVILLLVTISIPTELILRLTSPAIISTKGVPCVYDAFIVISLYSVWLYILAFILFYILYIEKYQLNPVLILRKRTIKKVWKDVLSDLLVMDLLFSLYITIVTVAAGFLMTGIMCNWEKRESRAYRFSGNVIENPPNIALIIITFFVIVFTLIFVAGSIMLYLWWITNWQWAGFVAAIVIISTENALKTGFLWIVYRLSDKVYINGIDIGWQIIYPTVLCIGVYILTMLTICRKDFLK